MSEQQKYEIAKQYVDKQLETMKGFDAAPTNISEEEYKSLIDGVAEMVEV